MKFSQNLEEVEKLTSHTRIVRTNGTAIKPEKKTTYRMVQK